MVYSFYLMPAENPKLNAYLKLVRESEEHARWSRADGLWMTGLTLLLVKATFAAMEAGLTFEEIEAAIQIGEQRGLSREETRPLQFDEALTPDYWQQVQQEAEHFWLKRYRGEA